MSVSEPVVAADEWIRSVVASDSERGLLRSPRRRDGGSWVRTTVDGRDVVEFSANDYLGLSVHPAVRTAAAEAAIASGVGATGSRHLSGAHAAILELEAKLAAFEGSETATVAPSGYAANMAVLTALGGEGAVVFSDEHNHASIIDGCRASRARVEVYRHRDVDDLQRRLERCAGRPVIVSDGVFSTSGMVADVAALDALARRHGAWLVVDEAHATGVLGADGGGAVSASAIVRGPHVATVVTFSKALGASGAAICGSASLRQLLLQRGRQLIYSTGLPHPTVAAVRAALEVLRSDPALRARLRALTAALHGRLDRVALTGHDCRLPMLAIPVGDAAATVALEERLWLQGWMVHALRPPTVPAGESRLRITLSALHEDDDVSGVADAVLTAIG